MVGQNCHPHDSEHATNGRHADRGMKQKQPDDEDGNPRHIQKCGRPHARQERAYLVKITQRLLHHQGLYTPQRQRGQRNVDRLLQAGIEQRSDAGQHAAAKRIEITLQEISHQHHQRQADQRRNVAARDHPVVDLQHVD